MMWFALDNSTANFYGQPILTRFLETSRRRLAPSAFSTGGPGFHRAAWSLRLVSCDPDSGETLTDHCAVCGSDYWWSEVQAKLQCQRCRAPIGSTAPAQQGSPREIEASRFWASLYSADKEQVVRVRGRLSADIGSLRPDALINVAEQMEASSGGRTSGLVRGAEMLLSWPDCEREMTGTAVWLVRRAIEMGAKRSSNVSLPPVPKPLIWSGSRLKPS
jgi:hypothetical protein